MNYPTLTRVMQFTTAKPLARFSLLALLLSGCSELAPPSRVEGSPVPVAASPVTPSPAITPAVVAISDPFVAAEDAAQGAIALTQSAVSPEDWKLIAQQWQRAILLLESVPKSDPKSATALEKLAGYRENFNHARQKSQQEAAASQSDAQPLPSGVIAITGSSSVQKGTKTSAPGDEAKLALAQHLAKTGAKLYAADNCAECQYQRDAFGPAASQIAEVKCDPKTKESEADPCKKAGILTFPTWEVKGKLYPGIRSLDELAQLSNFEGDRNFAPSPKTN